MRVGETKSFVPNAFMSEVAGTDPSTGKRYPRQVTGSVAWIHPGRRFYLVTYVVNGYQLRECFSQGE